MVNDIAGETIGTCVSDMCKLHRDAQKDNVANDIDLAAIAAAMLGFDKRRIIDGTPPSKI